MTTKITGRVNQGVGSIDLLILLFVAFKLAGIISWSWWWVLSPLWILIVVTVILAVIVGLANK